MLKHNVSDLPVISPLGRLAGMVTEGDFLRRPEITTERLRPRWLEFLSAIRFRVSKKCGNLRDLSGDT